MVKQVHVLLRCAFRILNGNIAQKNFVLKKKTKANMGVYIMVKQSIVNGMTKIVITNFVMENMV